MPDHIFSRIELNTILSSTIGKTLKEVDKNDVFARTQKNPKITGIAGDVIEQSVLGYKADTKQSADLLVDNIPVELKTTGIRYSKKDKNSIEAKEPMSITAVSPETIVNETFDSSKFWNKIAHTLFVYYLYDFKDTVKAAEYADFTIQGFQFHHFNEHDIKILQNDWSIVRNFIRNVKEEDIDSEYPKISKLRSKMMYLDTAPKWPHRPRFRLKRAVVTNIVKEHFGKNFEALNGSNSFNSYSELDEKLHKFTKLYKNQTIEQIATTLGFLIPPNKPINKSIGEQIVAKMFGAKTNKLRNIDTFAKLGIIPKTIVQNSKKQRTEDMKFESIDFNEWSDNNIQNFEDSYIYNFFSSQTMLYIIFRETSEKTPLEKTVFKGFKRLQFSDEFLQNSLKPVWNQVREMIWNNEVKVSKIYNKQGQLILTPKTKVPKEETNLPKSKDFDFFIRGTGSDAAKGKVLTLNGYKMYLQYIWIKGSTIIGILSKVDYV